MKIIVVKALKAVVTCTKGHGYELVVMTIAISPQLPHSCHITVQHDLNIAHVAGVLWGADLACLILL
jgi:hypothetical protein